ncbi:MAG: primosomal protein N', partial [Candidatus Cloacimonadaceae bacterium]|nr:primosomal protein N' [Candidatus Cloacimonadaceae bacterium]
YYHSDREELNCHYCGNTFPLPRRCPKCGGYSFGYGAPGTQKIEQLLQVYFPQAKLLRLDSDTASKKDMYRYMYDKMKNKEIDILLGTQMISKGLDFPGVTLVGVVSADISLNVPDFRSAERTFQLLTQVAGRAGRGDNAGRVIIQSYNINHYAIRHACKQDYESFATEEISYRKRLYYPPYYRLSRVVFMAKDQKSLVLEMQKVEELAELLKTKFPLPELFILGPVAAPNARVNEIYRYHLIFKAMNPQIMSEAILYLEGKLRLGSGISHYVDIDPMMLM